MECKDCCYFIQYPEDKFERCYWSQYNERSWFNIPPCEQEEHYEDDEYDYE